MILSSGLRRLALALSLLVGGTACTQTGLRAAPIAGTSRDADRIAAIDKALAVATGDAGPGAVVLVARDDRPIYRAARGQANIELGVPLAPDQLFKIASVTKIFTAAMVVKLAETGRLSLDDRLSAHLPDMGAAGTVTLSQLLNHTAGISERDATPGPGLGAAEVDTATRLAMIAKRPLRFAPGSQWAYSNSGYILLGAVIEKVTGQPWHEAVRSTLLAPLGLRRTGYDRVEVIQPGRVAGYTTANHQGPRNAASINMSIPAAAGAFVSTVDELLVWMRALSRGQVISQAGFQSMCEPATTSDGRATEYGFGLYLWTVRGQPVVGHTGQIDGFASVLIHMPNQNVTIVAIGNDDEFDARLFGRRVAAIMLDQPYSDATPDAVPTDLATAVVGEYQLAGNQTLALFMQDGRLLFRRGNRPPFALGIDVEGRLRFIPDYLTYYVPVRSPDGRVVGLDYFRDGELPATRLPRVAPFS